MSIDWPSLFNQVFAGCVTASVTIIGGVVVLVFGQLTIKFFIEPIHDQAKLLGEIAHSLTYYANVYGNADLLDEDIPKETSKKLRQQASELRASAWTIRWYWLWQGLGLVPKKNNVLKASENLIGLSNSVGKTGYDGSIHERQKEIKKLLGFM